MFEVNLLSSDGIAPPGETPIRGHEPEVIDLLSSSPVRTPSELRRSQATLAPANPETPPSKQPRESHDFELSSSPIFRVCEPSPRIRSDDFQLSSSPAPPPLPKPSTELLEAQSIESCISSKPQFVSERERPVSQRAAKRAFRSSTDVIPSKSKNGTKKFKASKTSSAPAAVKLVNDRKRACDEAKCIVWDTSGDWTELLSETLKALDVNATCESASSLVGLEGVSAIVTVSGSFSDEWDSEQHIFVKANAHIEFMNTHIVVLHASQLDALGKMERQSRDAYFQRIYYWIVNSGQCATSFSIVYVVPEVHAEFRKMMSAYDRRLRKRVMDHNNGLSVSAEQPPQQHYFNDVQVRLQVENKIRAVYPRTKAEAAEIIANWVIDMCFSRYRMRVDATLEGIGGSVKSKSVVSEITSEALAVVHGLPPRIASALAGDMKSIGKICTLLATDDRQRMARVRYYGKGDWNESLIRLLTCDDSEQTIGQV